MPLSTSRARSTGLMLAALVAGALGSGCGGGERRPGEPLSPGSTATVDGIEYTVPLTRQLNVNIPPDQSYYQGKPPPAGELLLGVFLEACNPRGPARRTTERFTLVNGFGRAAKPNQPQEGNPFAYEPRTLRPQACAPAAGSVTDRAARGALLVFQIPTEFLQMRPLKLEIHGPGRERATVALDI